MSGSVLTDAFAHHHWANMRILEVCVSLSDEQLATNVPGTYGSILETMRHIVGADASYLSLLSDGKVSMIEEESMSLDDLRTVSAGYGDAWADVVRGDLDANADVIRHRDDGTDSHATLGIRLAQALHHGTDHRSQICTALTTLGMEPPEIDAWTFAAQDGRAFITMLPTA